MKRLTENNNQTNLTLNDPITLSNEVDHQVATDFVGDSYDPSDVVLAPVVQEANVSQELVALTKQLAIPKLITTLTWDNTWTNSFVNVCSAFFNQASVKARTTLFPYIKGNLKIRLVVTGNAYLYGEMQAARIPPEDSVTASIQDIDYAHYARCSQLENIRLSPSGGSAGELTFPMCGKWNWYNASKNNTGAFQAVGHFGTLAMNELVPLTHSNGIASPNVNIQIWGWIEQDSLKVSALTAQAGECDMEVDPNSGKVSGALNKVSQLAMSVGAMVPALEGYAAPVAMASEMGAQIASLFGYSRKQAEEEISFTKNPVGRLMNSDGADGSERVSLLAESHLSLGHQHLTGGTQDQLELAPYVARKSILGIASWSTTDALHSPLAMINVSPATSWHGTVKTSYGNFPTPMHAVSRLFKYWRGNMVITVRAVASRFHSGAVTIAYDPDVAPSDGSDLGSRMKAVLDLGGDREIVFRVPYTHHIPYCEFGNENIANAVFNGVDLMTHPATTYAAGSVGMYIQSSLSCPSESLTPVYFVIEVHWEDVELGVPVTMPSGYFAQAGEVSGASNDFDKEEHKRHFGEVLKSVRTLMLRCTLSQSISVDEQVSGAFVQRPFWPWRIVNDSTPTSYIDYFLRQFNGFTGSFRVKAKSLTDGENTPFSLTPYKPASSSVTLPMTGDYLDQTSALSVIGRGHEGVVLSDPSGIAEIEVPMYTNERFVSKTDYDKYKMEIGTVATSGAKNRVYLVYTCLGPDVTMGEFTGIPFLYYTQPV